MKLRYAWATVVFLVLLTGASVLLARIVDPVGFEKVFGPKPPKGVRVIFATPAGGK